MGKYKPEKIISFKAPVGLGIPFRQKALVNFVKISFCREYVIAENVNKYLELHVLNKRWNYHDTERTSKFAVVKK